MCAYALEWATNRMAQSRTGRAGDSTSDQTRELANLAQDLKLLTETVPHMLWSATPRGVVDYVNQRVLDYSQLPRKELLGRGWKNAVHPDHVARMAEAWAASVETGEPFQFEFLGRHAPSGAWRWCVSSALPARNAAGQIIKWYGTIVDLHDRRQAEDARLRVERQYRMVIETASDAVVTIDQAGTITLVNPAASGMFGYRSSEIVGRPLAALIPHLPRPIRGIREATGLRHNGQEFPVEISFAEADVEGRRTLTGFIRDVTERKQAEAMRAVHAQQVAVRADVSTALASEGTLRGMLQGCAEAVVRHLDAAFARIWVIKDGRVLELQASAGMYTHLDGPHSRILVGQLKIGLIAEERVPHISNDLAHDPRISDPDWAQATRMVGFAGYPLLGTGHAIGVVAMFSRHPVTQATTESLAAIADAIAQGIQRKQAEEEVRRSEAFLAAAQALSQTGSWGWNARTDVLSWSRETYRIFDLDPDVVPTLSRITEAVHPDDRPSFERDSERLRHDRTDFEGEYRLRLADATVRHVHIVGRSVTGAFPDLDFIGSIMDVTDRKHAEEALLAAQARLGEVARLTTMGELAASIAHEINQPLATVVTNAKACRLLLRAERPPLADVHEAVTDIAQAATRASDVIERIRLLLRKGTPEPSLLEINGLIREVILWTRDAVGRRRVAVRTNLAPDLPPVRGDRVQLQQVLINLITNAVDAMAELTGRPRTLSLRSECNDNRHVEVAVADSGAGIDPTIRARIFEPFCSTKSDGMGMGLAICRSIVERHGGQLTASANQDFGTTMKCVLPAAGAEDA